MNINKTKLSQLSVKLGPVQSMHAAINQMCRHCLDGGDVIWNSFGQQSWLWRDLSIKEHITLSSHLAMIPCKPHVYIKITRISRRRRPWPWVIIKPKYCKDCFWYTCANFSQPIYVQRHWFRANRFAMYLYDVAFVIQGLVWGRPPPPEIWDYIC